MYNQHKLVYKQDNLINKISIETVREIIISHVFLLMRKNFLRTVLDRAKFEQLIVADANT